MWKTPALVATVTLLFLGAAGCDAPPDADVGDRAGPDKEILLSGGGAPFSPVVRSGNLLFLSGVVGVDRDAEDQGAAAETRRVLEGIQDRLEQVGSSMEDLVKCTVFLVDMDEYSAMNEVYSEFFPEDPPARSAVAVRDLPVGAEVEIECIGAAP